MLLFRINANDNDLRWPFAVDKYPSLVYFPALDKAESIPYTSRLPLTLPNLVEFVRHAAGPTADIGVCSETCILTNLYTTAVAVSKLQTERSRTSRAIHRLQYELKSMFSVGDGDGDSIELNSDTDHLLRLQLSDEDIDDNDRVDTKATSHPTTEANYEVRTHVADDEPKDFSDCARTSCSIERVLRVRDELATLRCHLHSVELKRSLLRHLYTHVLLPAAVRHSRQLERRRWRNIRRHKLMAGLRLHNYRDFVSGSDMGS